MRTPQRTTILQRDGRRGRRRATVLLEFMMVLPLFLYMILFTFDVGRMVVLYGALSDGAYVAARSNAQVGAVDQTLAEDTFRRATTGIPGAQGATVKVDVPPSACLDDSSYIQVTVTQDLKLLSPGVGAMLKVATGDSANLKATAQVLCEVVRT